MVRKLMEAFKIEYDTVRDLEKQGFRVFWITGAVLAVGIVCTMTAIGMVIGIPLILLGGIGFLGAIIWLSVHSKEPVRRIFCPYCTSTNEVYQSRTEFSCDICERRIAIGKDGEPIALEEE